MGDLIRRQDALSCFHDWIDKYGDVHAADEITEYRMIEQLASVEPERTGKWIYHSDWEADGECGYECSECGMGSDVDYNYCMRCGARMKDEGR